MAKSSKPSASRHSGTDHLLRNFPFESKISIRLLTGSATYTWLLVGLTVTEVTPLNCPSPFPSLPQFASTLPPGQRGKWRWTVQRRYFGYGQSNQQPSVRCGSG